MGYVLLYLLLRLRDRWLFVTHDTPIARPYCGKFDANLSLYYADASTQNTNVSIRKPRLALGVARALPGCPSDVLGPVVGAVRNVLRIVAGLAPGHSAPARIL